MHHHTLSNLTPVDTIIAFAALFLVLYIHFLPTITAIKRNSTHKVAVVIVNIFFGVTLIGWLVALLLASKQTAASGRGLQYPAATAALRCCSTLDLTAYFVHKEHIICPASGT